MRLFVAVELPEAAVERLARLVRELGGPGVRWVAPGLWHVTIKFLGEVPAGALPEVTGALSAATIGLAAFDWECRGCGGFPDLRRPRVVWAGVGQGRERMVAAAGRIEAALEGAGFAAEARPFHPHVTLGRVTGPLPPGLLERLGRERETLFGEGEAQRVVLMESVLSPTGPVYSVAGAWPIGQGL